MNVEVKLSKLVACRKNPRRVKPERDAHRRLVASIRAHGLIEPLVVSPIEEGQYRVIAGNRRLAALRDVFRGEDAKISCVVRVADRDAAASLSLAENFAREPMHSLDEAEAFARLASVECKGVSAIAVEFGVRETYVRQRIKLASLAQPIKDALRADEIGVGIAEAFAAVPPERQRALWLELGGCPRSAEQVRSMIEDAWIPADRALFDIRGIEPSAISHDLFGGSVLIERRAFIAAQEQAVKEERVRVMEDGWGSVVIAHRDTPPDEFHRMSRVEPTYDAATMEALDAIGSRRQEVEETESISPQHEQEVLEELRRLDQQEADIVAKATPVVDETTKAHATVFLLISPDGRVERQERLPKKAEGLSGEAGSGDEVEPPRTLTPADLTDTQRAHLLTHELIAVRDALSRDALARKRLLVMVLHDRIGRDALALRRIASGAGLHAETAEGFASPLVEAHRERRRAVDPFTQDDSVTEVEAYQTLTTLPEEQLDALIGVLVVEFLTASLQAPTPLVRMLAGELSVSLRDRWAPDAAWLAGYRKSQLAHIIGELQGPAHGSAALQRKKSELVTELAELFGQSSGQVVGTEGAGASRRVRAWMPLACNQVVGV